MIENANLLHLATSPSNNIMQINFGPPGIDIATVANPAYEGHIMMTSNQTEDSLYSDVQGHVGRL